MKLKELLYKISFVAGLIIILVGLYLKFFNITSASSSMNRFTGEVGVGYINGKGTIFIGLGVLLFSCWSYIFYLKEEEKLKKKREEEKHTKQKHRIE